MKKEAKKFQKRPQRRKLKKSTSESSAPPKIS